MNSAAPTPSIAIAPPAAIDWLHDFQPFTTPHFVTVAILAVAMGVAVALGRRWRTTPRERRLRAAWVGFIILWQAFATIWWLLPGNFSIGKSLPLHICDLVAWFAAFALVTNSRLMRSLLYFWGIGLSTQAFFTPLVEHGPAYVRFWLFWIGHTQIVGSAIYDICVRRFRPTLRDYALASVANALYTILIVPLNIALGANYGYLGDISLGRDTLLRVLGPWPHRIFWMWLIVQVGMTLMWLVWPSAAFIGRGRGDLSTPIDDQTADSPL